MTEIHPGPGRATRIWQVAVADLAAEAAQLRAERDELRDTLTEVTGLWDVTDAALREAREDAADARRERDQAMARQRIAQRSLDDWRAAAEQAVRDRDRARDIAVAVEQQLDAVERAAYEGGQDGETVRRRILGIFEDARPRGGTHG